MALSTSQTRRAWSAYKCNRKGWLEITFLGRSPVRIIDLCADAWAACETALKASGYTSADIVGSYNCRKIAGRPSGSLHGYRLALDLDPRKNWKHLPFSRTKITRRNVAAVEAIRTVNGKQVILSGSRFADNMHLQIACTPADIKTGINWATVQGHPRSSRPAATPRDPGAAVHHATVKFGAHGDDVKDLQAGLNAYGDPDPHLGVDGRFGNKTRSALRSYQRSHHLTVDGIAGPETWALLDEV